MATLDNTSASRGYLSPVTCAPDSDFDLDLILQSIVVGLTGLDGALVLPRWQPNDEMGDARPRIPSIGTTWCAVGHTDIIRDDSPAQIHDSDANDGDGSTTLTAHETIEALASFYGPKAQGYALLMRDGFNVAQNREGLVRMSMAFLDAGPTRALPELINTRTRRKYDLPFRLRRCVERTYNVLNVRQGVGTLLGDTTDVIITQPFQTPET